MVICLERGADLHTDQLMPLPLTVSSFSKIQIGFTFLVPAYTGSPGQRAIKRACVCGLWSPKTTQGSKRELPGNFCTGRMPFPLSHPTCSAGTTDTHQFNGPLSGTTRVSRYQKSKTNLDSTGATDSDWQWHQLGHMRQHLAPGR